MGTSRITAAAIIACLAAAGSCSSRDDSPVGPIDVDPTTAASRSIAGKTAYDRHCARCHDSGANGAPRTGDPVAWSDRSPLWQSVLFQHAEEGYLEMPAGGGGELAPEVVEAAAEYMLGTTFPDYSPERDD